MPDHVADLRVGDRADGEVAATFIGQRAVFALHRLRGGGPHADLTRKRALVEQAGVETVIEVVAVVRDFIRKIGDLCFERRVFRVETFSFARVIGRVEMFHQTFAHFPREIQTGEPGIFLLEFFDDAQAVMVVLETAVSLHQAAEHRFAAMTEG